MPRRISLKSLVFLYALALPIVGCVHDKQRQIVPPQMLVPSYAAPSGLVAIHDHPSIATIEFNDKGGLLSTCPTPTYETSKCQLNYAHQMIVDARTKASKDHRQLVVLTFVHGWHHNARLDDGNFTHFTEMVDCLNWGETAYRKAYADRLSVHKADEKHVPCKGLQSAVGVYYVGVYIGWRGALLSGVVDYFTISSRQHAAERIGGSILATVFENLRVAAKAADGTNVARLIIIGHSLGGLIVEKVSSSILSASFDSKAATNMETCSDNSTGHRSPFDLFVLLNPASNAVPARLLINKMKSTTFCSTDKLAPTVYRPMVVSIHSKSDTFTGVTGFEVRRIIPSGGGYAGPAFPPSKRADCNPPSNNDMRVSTAGHLVYFDSLCYIDSENIRSDSKTGDWVCDAVHDQVATKKQAAFVDAGLSLPSPGPTTSNVPDSGDGAYELAVGSGQRVQQTLGAELRPLLAVTPLTPPAKPSRLLNLYTRLDYLSPCNPDNKDKSDPRPLCSAGAEPPSQLPPWNSTPYWIFNVPDDVIHGHDGFWTAELVGILDGLVRTFDATP